MKWKAVACVAVATFFVAPTSLPANALTMTVSGSTCSPSAVISRTYTKAWAGTCTKVQARIDGYVSNYPTPYYGGISTYSIASIGAGVYSGNYGKAWIGSSASSWQRLKA